MSILDDIVAQKRTEVRSLPPIMPAPYRGPSFIGAILAKRPSLIAEIKPASPSEGQLLKREDIPSLVQVYDRHAQAISVLCDEHFFDGGFDLLRQVRALSDKPLLAKEFIIDPVQIDHAAANGASAILLIAAILPVMDIATLAMHAITLHLDVLLEIHSHADLEKAAGALMSLTTDAKKHIMLGINNRDLATLATDISITERLAPLIRKRLPGIAIISESGIHTREDIERLESLVDGFLIGRSILKAKNPGEHLASLFGTKPKIKFCGMTRSEDVAVAERLGADYIGFVFVPSSPRSVTVDQARILRKSIKKAKVVGVFEGNSSKDIRDCIQKVGLDLVQIYGDNQQDEFSIPVIRAFRGIPASTAFTMARYVLIDKAPGENAIDLEKIAALPSSIQSRMFLAGGLIPENVAGVVEHVHPYAVDCARGIESSPGIKDHQRMSAFFSALSYFDSPQYK